MTATPNRKFEIPLAFLIGFLCVPTGLFVVLDLLLRIEAPLGMSPRGPTPLLAAIMLDAIVLALVGVIPLIAALGLWLLLLFVGRSRAAKLATFVCLLLAIVGFLDLRLMGPHR